MNQIRFEEAVEKQGLAWSLTRKPISQDLGLGKEQIESIRKTKLRAEKELVDEFIEFEERVRQIKSRSMTKMLNRLTASQREKLNLSKEQILKLVNPKL